MTTLLPVICTADVTNGSDTVTVHGVILSPANCVAPAIVQLAGIGYSVKTRLSTTQFQLSRTYEGSDAAGISCEIAPWTSEMSNRTELTKSLLEYSAQLSLLDSRGHGLFYQTLSYTAEGDPGVGRLARNASNWSAVTTLYLDNVDASPTSIDQTPIIELWTPGTLLLIQSIETGQYAAYGVNTAPIDMTGWFKLPNLTYIGGTGPADGEDIRIVWVLRETGLTATPRGDWLNSTSYAVLDLVQHGGYTFVSNVAGNLNNEPTVSPAAASSAYWTWLPMPAPGDFLDLTMFAQGYYDDGALLLRAQFASGASFPAGLTGSRASAAGTPATDMQLVLKKNGGSIGSVDFTAGHNDATFTFDDPETFVAGDILEVFAPSPNDTSLSDVTLTLRGTRDASLSLDQKGTAVVDFGAGATSTSVDITGIGRLGVDNVVYAWLWPAAGTADHNTAAHEAANITVRASRVVAGTGFTILAFSPTGATLTGKWNVAYAWF